MLSQLRKASALVLSSCLLLAATVQGQVNPASTTLYADSNCPSGQDYCLTGIYNPSAQTINYTMIARAPLTGWRGVGQSTTGRGNMAQANMVVGWTAQSQTVLTHRSASSNAYPTEALATSGYTPSANVSRIEGDKAIFNWVFPQTSTPTSNWLHIWAANTAAGPSSTDTGSTFQIHNDYGRFTMDFTKAYDGSAPAVPSGVSALAGYNGTISTTTTSDATTSGSGGSGSSSSKAVWIAHMVFMLLAWLIVVPAGILVARWGRLSFKWFPTHRGLQLLAYLFLFIGFFLAVGQVQSSGSRHFGNTHEQLGLAVFILTTVQIIGGQVGHVYKHKGHEKFKNWPHIVLGLTTFILSIVTIHYGFEEWMWDAPDYASYIVYVWTAVLAIVYVLGVVYISRKRKQIRSESKVNGVTGGDEKTQRSP